MATRKSTTKRPVGRPRRPRWPEIPQRYHNPSKLTGIERRIYEALVADGSLPPEEQDPAVAGHVQPRPIPIPEERPITHAATQTRFT